MLFKQVNFWSQIILVSNNNISGFCAYIGAILPPFNSVFEPLSDDRFRYCFEKIARNTLYAIYYSIFNTVVGGSQAIMDLYFVPEITQAFNLMLQYQLNDLVYQQAANYVCDQSVGSLKGCFREILACDWPNQAKRPNGPGGR